MTKITSEKAIAPSPFFHLPHLSLPTPCISPVLGTTTQVHSH